MEKLIEATLTTENSQVKIFYDNTQSTIVQTYLIGLTNDKKRRQNYLIQRFCKSGGKVLRRQICGKNCQLLQATKTYSQF